MTLVLFEHIHCDKNGSEGERRAYERYGWTNSGLFVKLEEEGIIKPLVGLKEHLEPYKERVRADFRNENAASIEEKAATVNVAEQIRSLDEFFYKWIARLLEPFLRRNGASLYEWPIARLSNADISEMLAEFQLNDFLWFEVGHVPLVKRIGDLSEPVSTVFRETQNLEGKFLPQLRLGQMSHEEYLECLKDNHHKYQIIDEELGKGVQQNFETILRLRERFRRKRGWEFIQGYLEISMHTSVTQRDKLRNAIKGLIGDCIREENLTFRSLDTPSILRASPQMTEESSNSVFDHDQRTSTKSFQAFIDTQDRDTPEKGKKEKRNNWIEDVERYVNSLWAERTTVISLQEHSVILTLLVGAADTARIPDRTCRYTWRSEAPTSHCCWPHTTRLQSA